ncbi:MAG: FAD-dependent oxidoreductase [Gammaproteobacteria bacterium]|nr:FAD-dependent oxidoreductase [Gammaproteobacteria bacterium]
MDRLLEFKDHYDLAVVGGGIHGAAVAWEAASRGLSVVLLESRDFASGASANSLKIIHGGLRYLQSLDVKRARDSAREQLYLSRLAPHLIRPLPCVMPTYRELKKSRLALGLGLSLYKFLIAPAERAFALGDSDRLITRDELHRMVPVRLADGITGGALWHDAQVYNAERLVIEFIMSARSQGADTINYARVDGVSTDDGRVRAVRVSDQLTECAYEVSCSAVMYATGAYEREIGSGPGTDFVRAVNVILPVTWGRHALGVAVPATRIRGAAQTRLLFFVPWRGHTMVGTWYFPDRPELGDKITKQELQECLDDVQSVLAGGRFAGDAIDIIHIGRLPSRSGSSPEAPQLRERFEVWGSERTGGPQGMYRLIGTKYTTARQAAAHAVAKVIRAEPGMAVAARDHERRLDTSGMDSFADYLERTQAAFEDRLSPDVVYRLARNYGVKADEILSYGQERPDLLEPIPGAPGTLKAEVCYVLDHELAYCLDDVLFRRTDLATLTRPQPDTVRYCCERMRVRYDWDQTEQSRQTSLVEAHFDKVAS